MDFFSGNSYNMFSLIRTTSRILSNKIPLTKIFGELYHSLNKPVESCNILTPSLLSPTNFNLVQTCGFKVKGKPRRRCKDCFFVVREQRVFVLCKSSPRHKQMSMVKDPRNTWMLSHATQSKVRPW